MLIVLQDAFGGEFVRNEVVLTNQKDMTTKDARVHEGCAPHSGEVRKMSLEKINAITIVALNLKFVQ